jgi:hypothetical protein
MAQSAPAMAQTIEAYVGERMDDARMGPVHWQVLALVASGYFFDVLDFTIFGALVPDLIKSGFRFFDQAERDRHHALRRIQRRRTLSIANWLMVPWLIAGAAVIGAVWLW